MNIKVTKASVSTFDCDAVIVNLFEGVAFPGGATGAVDQALDGLLTQLIEQQKFEGKLGQTLVVHTHGKIPARLVIVAGLGPSDKFGPSEIRKASSAAVRAAAQAKAAHVASITHGSGIGGKNPAESAQATVEGAILGTYAFSKYKSEKPSHQIEQFTIVETNADIITKLEAGAERGRIVAEAANYARDLVNTPANDLSPETLAEAARQIAAENSLELEILEREEVEKLGMGVYAAVTRGSSQPPKFVTLRYSVPGATRTVAIIGKAVTFDSGGLSLKTAEGMTTMKDDMSGAAAVLGAMKTVAALSPELNVLAIIPATENMPDGNAMRPGDVVRAMNGKTIEIENTDAEGRLTLSDALCYAVSKGADELIDLATLTGACVIALGRAMSGLFCNNDDLAANLTRAGEASGELLWRMPLFDDYFELIKSETADMKNTGGREAGATTAALLIREFAGDKPWAHIDIAGPAFMATDTGLFGKGGTGVGVRLLTEYLSPPDWN